MGIRPRTVWRWIIGLAAFLVVVAAVLFAFREPILRRVAQLSIEESTGLRAEIGELKSGLSTSVFEVRDLTLYNLKEFGGTLLARIPELAVDVDTERAAQGVLHLRILRLHVAELHVIKSQNGLNLDGVEKTVREHVAKRLRRRREEKVEFQFGGIDQLQLTLRQVRVTDLNRPERTRQFDLRLENESVTTLKTEEDFQTWLGALIFRIVMEQSLGRKGDGAISR